jgi:hypothetical protein
MASTQSATRTSPRTTNSSTATFRSAPSCQVCRVPRVCCLCAAVCVRLALRAAAVVCAVCCAGGTAAPLAHAPEHPQHWCWPCTHLAHSGAMQCMLNNSSARTCTHRRAANRGHGAAGWPGDARPQGPGVWVCVASVCAGESVGARCCWLGAAACLACKARMLRVLDVCVESHSLALKRHARWRSACVTALCRQQRSSFSSAASRAAASAAPWCQATHSCVVRADVAATRLGLRRAAQAWSVQRCACAASPQHTAAAHTAC